MRYLAANCIPIKFFCNFPYSKNKTKQNQKKKKKKKNHVTVPLALAKVLSQKQSLVGMGLAVGAR